MIVNLQEAKQHLRVDIDDDDDNIVLKRDQAEAIVIDYLKLDAGTYDIDASPYTAPPKPVTAAILMVLTNLYDNPDQDPLSVAVRSILHRLRDPALA